MRHRPSRRRPPDERHLQPRAAAHLARRRRHRPALVLPRARRLPRLRRDRQVRLHAHAHGLPAALPDEVLARSRRSTTRARSATRSCARRCCATGSGNPLEIASVADVPAGTGMGSSGAFTVCLLKALAHGAAHVDHARRARRGRVRDRDRHPQGAGRQAGPVRRRARRHLRLHVQRRRHASTSSRSSSARETLAQAARQLPALLHRRGARRVGDARATRTSARARGDSEMLENLHRTKEIGLPEPRAARGGRPRRATAS